MSDKQNKPAVTSNIRESFNELAKIKDEFTPEQKKYIMSTIAPGLNENETLLFLMKASILKLNPLMGEIFAYVSKAKREDGSVERQLVMITARDGKRSVASRVGDLEYIRTEAVYVKQVQVTKDENSPAQTMKIQVEPWDGTLWGARSEVKRSGQEPFVVTIPLSEYQRSTTIWKYKPETMIKKVAESQALSAAYPEILTGVYDESERWDTQETIPADNTPKIEGGSEPATDQMMKTIEVLGGDTKQKYTKQEAVNEIARLQAEAKNKKAKPAKPEVKEEA